MSVRQEVSDAAYQTGFQNLTTRINVDPRLYPVRTALSEIEAQLVAGKDLMDNKSLDDVLREHKVNELIGIYPLTTQTDYILYSSN